MGGVDVVLDDGSHIATLQRISFEALFPMLPDGGLYIIEDTHTAYWPLMEGELEGREPQLSSASPSSTTCTAITSSGA